MTCNWDDPVARARFLQLVGIETYTKAFEEHRARTRVAVVNGYDIHPVNTRFGRLFMVSGGDRRAFATLNEAKAYANKLGAKK